MERNPSHLNAGDDSELQRDSDRVTGGDRSQTPDYGKNHAPIISDSAIDRHENTETDPSHGEKGLAAGKIISASDVDYSIFTPRQRKFMVAFAAIGSCFSPISTTIYLPALNTLAADLHVSNAEINLTITTFLIMQGLAPAMVAGFSDGAGRRPAYMICFVIYIAANIGLAVQRDYAALLVLRCLQSAGSSGTVAVAQGVVADVATSAERGKYVAFTSIPTVVGPILGPILGGILAQYGGWPWIFWFLTIASSAYFVPFLLFFPETCRKVVGNGSVRPPILNMSLTDMIRHRHRSKANISPEPAQEAYVAANYRLSVPNPLSTLSIIADREAALLLFCSGLVFAALYSVNVGIPSQFGAKYHFNEIQIGLAFIPFGAGGVVSAFTTGKCTDLSWRWHARRANLPLVKNRQQDLTNFPIERARLVVAIPFLYLSACAMIAFGWVLKFPTPLAAPLVVLFFVSYGIIAAFQVTQILIMDLNQGNAAAATAANNLFRCLLGAGATAVVVPMIERIGPGWTYTFAALLWVAFTPFLWVLAKWGPRWRISKIEKRALKEEKERS